MPDAVFAGSFDPITNGHLDIIYRSIRLFDHVYVVVANNPDKKYMFTLNERTAMAVEALSKHWLAVTVVQHDGMVVDFARSKDAKVLVRGVRSSHDLAYEVHVAEENKKLDPTIETVVLLTNAEYQGISSSKVKDLAFSDLWLDAGLVPIGVEIRLKEKAKEYHARYR